MSISKTKDKFPDDITQSPAAKLPEYVGYACYWQCAYADAFDHHHVLRGQIYDRLNQYDKRENRWLQKLYLSFDAAMKDYHQARLAYEATLLATT